MPCTHNFEDFWASGYDKCLNCGVTKRSRYEGVLTHLMDEDGELYPNPACTLYNKSIDSNVSISLILSSGEVIEGL